MRLIDADELLTDNTWTWFDEWDNKTPVGEIIFNAPTIDAVPREWHDKCMQIEIQKRFGMEEVVRCKDCKFCHAGYCEMADDIIPFGLIYHEWENFYCAWGEWREDEVVHG